jgi:hypothetical protein
MAYAVLHYRDRMRNCSALEDKMTPEELKYYTALQPLFREKMGEHKKDDRLYFFYRGKQIEASVYRTYEGMVHLFTEEFGRINLEKDDPAFIRLPLPVDPRNPERGLWGMVDWNKWHLEPQRQDSVIIYGINDNYGKVYDCEGTPTLALLKALAVQEGIGI